jgi:hypothetical protein
VNTFPSRSRAWPTSTGWWPSVTPPMHTAAPTHRTPPFLQPARSRAMSRHRSAKAPPPLPPMPPPAPTYLRVAEGVVIDFPAPVLRRDAR